MKGIYAIKNKLNGKLYIGQTVNLKKRSVSHFSDLRNGRHYNDHLQKSFLKYGEENFEFIVLEANDNFTKEELDLKEIYYISKYNTLDWKFGYNKAKGGLTGSRLVSQEEREWRSKYYKGENNPFYGKTHTEETKQYLSELAATRIGSKNPFYGKTHSSDWKEKRKDIYDTKRSKGWIDPKKGKKKPKESIEQMKKNMPHRIPLMVDGVRYNSIAECAKALGMHASTINRRLKNPKFKNYISLKK